ncbi:hypothetical protein [Planctomicrobium sp. SH527]|uniref:hypothetical protein n=1 Tax=Planctomicrobium sp. SH527 TaxID=3448123 RepID=UPI003F5CB92C
MFLIVLILAAMLGVAGVLIWIGCQRVAVHLRDKPEATGQVVEHVLMPLLGNATRPDSTRGM